MQKESSRIRFEKRKQKAFLLDAKIKLSLTWTEFSIKLGISSGTMQSYFNEYCTLTETLFEDVCSLCGWNNEGILSKYNACREQTLGKRRIFVLDVPIENNKEIPLEIEKTIMEIDDGKCKILPRFLSEELAEESGIHLGDGFLSSKKFDFRVKGDRSNEREYYDDYMTGLYSRLYGITLNNKDYKTSYGFEIYSKKLWFFKTKVLGIPPGKKDTIGIPKIIKNADAKMICAFLRGLLDTDGCFQFLDRYGRKGYYPTISLSCKSPILADDVSEVFSKLGFTPKQYKKKDGSSEIYLNGYSNFERYEKIIGWSNPKNKVKVALFHRNWPQICRGHDSSF